MKVGDKIKVKSDCYHLVPDLADKIGIVKQILSYPTKVDLYHVVVELNNFELKQVVLKSDEIEVIE